MSTFPTLGQIEISKKKADVESIEKLSYLILTLIFNKKVPCKQRRKKTKRGIMDYIVLYWSSSSAKILNLLFLSLMSYIFQ